MIYLFLSILFTTSLVLLFKTFEAYKLDLFQVISFNYITASVLCYLLLDEPLPPEEIINQDWFIHALCIGFLFICLFNLIGYSAQKIGVSITSVASKLSLAIPVLFGFVFYKDSVSLVKLTGIIVALVSIYFTSKKSVDGSEGKKSVLIALLIFVGTGILDTLLIYSQEHYSIVDNNLDLVFSASLYAIAACIAFPFLLVRHFTGSQIVLKNIIGGVILGIPNVISLVFFFNALNYYPESTFVFPINNMGIVIATAIFAKLFFKEHLSRKNYFGVVLALVAIFLISIS